ncbi:MAG: hypothetical protein AB1489_01950 [Acidobacteriota bacterium]
MRSQYIIIGLMLILFVGMIPKPTNAAGSMSLAALMPPIPITTLAPIGRIDSLGTFSVNGRLMGGNSSIRGGDLLQTFDDTGASVEFPVLGKAQLTKGTVVRFYQGARKIDTESSEQILMITLLSGNLAVDLKPTISAYLQAGEAIFTTIEGARFRTKFSNGQIAVYGEPGTINDSTGISPQSSTQKYFLRPVGMGASVSVRARSTRQIQIQVTDEHDKPVPDLPIFFLLGSGKSFGSLGSMASASMTTTTNNQGIASITFNAGDTPGSTNITATVEGTNYSWTGEIVITKAVGFWTMKKTLLVTAAAAAGISTGIAITNAGSNTRSAVKPLPPGIRP